MSTQEFLEKLQRVKHNIAEDDTPLKLGSYSAIALQATRIFTNGLKTDGTRIGTYSTRPAYFTANQARKKGSVDPPTGKTGKSVFANGEPHKSKFFEGGYKQFRQDNSLNGDFVNLQFHDDLFFDFVNVKSENGSPSTRKVANQQYISAVFARNNNVKKRQVLEEKYGTIFWLSKTELDKFYETVRFQLRKLIAAA